MRGALLALDPLFHGHVSWSVLAVVIIKVVVAFVILLVAVMLYIWAMRKVIADMQNRIGPNRAGPYGVLQTLADGIKLFFKEQSIPSTADRPVFRLAPYLSIMPAFLMFCIVPIGGTVSILGHRTYLQVADLPMGALFILAMLIQAGTLSTHGIASQQAWTHWSSFVGDWFWFRALVPFGIFLIAATA